MVLKSLFDVTQDGWLLLVPLDFAQGSGLLPYFELPLTLEPLLLRLFIQAGWLEFVYEALLFLFNQGAWFPELLSVLFFAQGGDGVELLVFLRYWLMGLFVYFSYFIPRH